MTGYERWHALPFWKKVAWAPLVAIMVPLNHLGRGFDWFAPGITGRKIIDLPTREIVIIKQLPNNNWGIASSVFMLIMPVVLWGICYAKTDPLWGKALYGALLGISGARVVPAMIVIWHLIHRSAVVIGDLPKDIDCNATTTVAAKMLKYAKERKIPMNLLVRNDVLRAYFEDDDAAVTVRLAC